MGQAQYWIIGILVLVLLIALAWLATRKRSNETTPLTEEATREEYAEEDELRREGKDER
jgi:cytochrome c-type biogenesis protein CcmH/NrfF